MSAEGASPAYLDHGLARAGGLGLGAFAALYLGRESLDYAAGPPPNTADDLLRWMTAHERLLATQSEVLFFALMCLIPVVPALYDRLKQASPVSAALGCGTLAAAVPLLAMLDAVHGRFAFPVYGLRVDTPAIAAFAVAVYYGGLHAVQLMLGFAIVTLTLALRRSKARTPPAWSGGVAAAAAVLNGYPWVIGPSASLVLQGGVAVWWATLAWALYHTE